MSIDKTKMDQLLTSNQQLLSSNKEISSLLKQLLWEEKRKNTEGFVDPDEAAYLLGFVLTPSGTHRRRVAWLHKEAAELITTMGEKPPMYLKKEVLAAAKRIEIGEVIVPTYFPKK